MKKSDFVEIEIKTWGKLVMAYFTEFPEEFRGKNITKVLNLSTPLALISLKQPEIDLHDETYGATLFCPGERKDYDGDIMTVLAPTREEVPMIIAMIQTTINTINEVIRRCKSESSSDAVQSAT